MSEDEKRFYRELKRDLKRRGNRQRRRFLKNVDAEPADFEFGSSSSARLNGIDEAARPARNENPEENDELS